MNARADIDLHVERDFIGSSMRAPDKLALVRDRITPHTFSDSTLAEIFRSICAVIDDGRPFIRSVIALECRATTDITISVYLAKLSAESPKDAPVERLADILTDLQAQRARAFDEPGDLPPPIGEPMARKPDADTRTSPRFTLEPFETIVFESREEWLVKRLIPRQGVGAFYGASQSFKSFVVSDLAWHVAIGQDWAERRVTQAPAVYIAAEGAAGLRKRKVGFERSHSNLPATVPFYLISAAPNLGTEQGDLALLTAAIEAAGVTPGLIVVDTLAQSLGAGDENGGGMIQFVANATALANKFRAFVLIIHHVGLGDDKRMRGHSSLIGGLDAQILCERKDGALSTSLTLQKLKDEASSIKLIAHLDRVVLGQDEDGDDISTLVVESIEDGLEGESGKQPKTVPRAQRLLMDMVAVALDEAGETFRPFADGPLVRAVADGAVRERYYGRLAESPKPDDTPKKLADRQRQAFCASIKKAIDAKMLVAALQNGERLLWPP